MSTATERIASIAATGMWTQLRAQQLATATVSISWTGLSSSNKSYRIYQYLLGTGGVSTPLLRINNDIASNYTHRPLSSAGSGKYGTLSITTSFYLRNMSVAPGEAFIRDVIISKGASADDAMLLSTGGTGDNAGSAFSGIEGGNWSSGGSDINRIDLIISQAFDVGSFASLEGDQT